MTTSQKQSWPPDWDEVPDAAVPRLLAEAREHLRGIVAMGTNSDQRSVALGGVFAAGAFALFTGAATVFIGDHRNFAMVCASAVTGLLFMIASAFCLAAAMPSDFFIAGYAPRDLIAYAEDTLWMKISTIEDFQRRIDANRANLANSASLIQRAIYFALSGIVAGTLISSAGFATNLPPIGIIDRPTLAMAVVGGMILTLLAALLAETRRY